MPDRSGKKSSIFWWLVLAGFAGLALVWILGKPPATLPIAQPASAPSPATVASALPATAPAEVDPYGRVLHADLPHYPQTRPWMVGVELVDAAHLILPEPIYICPRGDLWITRSDADPIQKILLTAGEKSEHVVDRPVSFIVWIVSKRGLWQPLAICPTKDGYDLVSATDSRSFTMHANPKWEFAQHWTDGPSDRVIVPTDNGVSVLTLGNPVSESYVKLCDGPAHSPRAQIWFDVRGVLAWCPVDDRPDATAVVARFVDGAWKTLSGPDWPGSIIQLLPMQDGSVMQVLRGSDAGTVQLTMVQLDASQIDETQVKALVDQLSDDDPDKRAAAKSQLTQYGPGVLPILEKFLPDAPPEAQARLHELLQGKLSVLLGGMQINENKMSVLRRLHDGGVIFYLPEGVSIPRDQQEPLVVTPDYLVLRPSAPVREVPASLVAQLTPGATLDAIRDEWIVTTSELGPQRFLPPDELIPLLRDSEKPFENLIAIDGRDRWYFRQPDKSTPTLIIDPTVPDPNPRLAIWQIEIGTEVGWTTDNWPAITHGKEHWKLMEKGWEIMKPDEPMLTSLRTASTAPSTEATTGPSTRQEREVSASATQPAGPDGDGNWRVADQNGIIFLIKTTGGIQRLSPASTQPEAVFRRRVPYFRETSRVWLDPANRIVIAYGSDRLALIFPSGQLPPELEDEVLPQDLIRIEPAGR